MQVFFFERRLCRCCCLFVGNLVGIDVGCLFSALADSWDVFLFCLFPTHGFHACEFLIPPSLAGTSNNPTAIASAHHPRTCVPPPLAPTSLCTPRRSSRLMKDDGWVVVKDKRVAILCLWWWAAERCVLRWSCVFIYHSLCIFLLFFSAMGCVRRLPTSLVTSCTCVPYSPPPLAESELKVHPPRLLSRPTNQIEMNPEGWEFSPCKRVK